MFIEQYKDKAWNSSDQGSVCPSCQRTHPRRRWPESDFVLRQILRGCNPERNFRFTLWNRQHHWVPASVLTLFCNCHGSKAVKRHFIERQICPVPVLFDTKTITHIKMGSETPKWLTNCYQEFNKKETLQLKQLQKMSTHPTQPNSSADACHSSVCPDDQLKTGRGFEQPSFGPVDLHPAQYQEEEPVPTGWAVQPSASMLCHCQSSNPNNSPRVLDSGKFQNSPVFRQRQDLAYLAWGHADSNQTIYWATSSQGGLNFWAIHFHAE